MTYVLDTNILVHTLRDSPIFHQIENQFDPYGLQNEAIISTVSVGEIYSFAKRNHWGKNKMYKVKELFKSLKVIAVEGEDMMETYADIDAFSQSSHPTLSLRGSARKMGKNDLWIAATAFVFDSVLLTTDADFNHLHNVFIQVEYIPPIIK